MFNNARVFDFDGPVKVSLYWGWENGEGRLGLRLFDFSMWHSDEHYVTLFNLDAWVISFSVALDFDWRPNTGSSGQRTLALSLWLQKLHQQLQRLWHTTPQKVSDEKMP